MLTSNRLSEGSKMYFLTLCGTHREIVMLGQGGKARNKQFTEQDQFAS